jgi:anti-sigma regulatory factor (Ser/Thr protein kinase)
MGKRPLKTLKMVSYVVSSTREAIGNVRESALEVIRRMGVAVNLKDLELVLNETLTNALLYGNLRIPSDLRESRGVDAFWKTVTEREQDREFHTKEIVLRIECLEDRLLLTVSDQGEGFDWKGFMRAMAEDKEAGANQSQRLATHGRGLFIVRHYADEIAWNEKGNEVRFTIRFSPKMPGRQVEKKDSDDRC